MIKMLWVAGIMAGAGLASGSVMAPVMADDQLMILYPHQRESHQNKMDEDAARYQARGQEYVDHLYATGGEEPMSEPDDFMNELDDNVVPVDVGQVADIVKQQGRGQATSPP